MTAPVKKRTYNQKTGLYESAENESGGEPDLVIRTDENSIEPIWKYNEDKIIEDFRDYLASTYKQHYKVDIDPKNSPFGDNDQIECFDAWIALGDSAPTFRNTALKYLWRYGKKGGNNEKDLMKALHYVILMLHVNHYKGPLA